MAFKKPTLQRSATEINKITGFIMGVRKFGKTTLWANMIEEKFGDPERGLLVSCGMEHGTSMIDRINTTHINTYKELAELKQWLLSTKGTEHNIEMICFDSGEELFGIFEKETIRRSNIENPTKQVKSIKAAYSGFTNGEKECAKLVKEFLNELYGAGIVPWMIGHTKLKTYKDKASLDEDGFQKLGSSLIADYEAAVADCFDIIVTGLIDREIEERGKGDSIKRYVKETERRLYFRGNEMVEAGGRLKGLTVPEYIVFDQENMAPVFIKTVEDALRAGRVDNVTSKSISTKTSISATVEDEPETDTYEEDTEIEATEEEETSADKASRIEECRTLFKAADVTVKKQVKAILNGGKLDLEMDDEVLDKIYALLTTEDEV